MKIVKQKMKNNFQQKKYGRTEKMKLKKLIFWIKLINPVLASMCFMVRPHFRPYSAINTCGGPIGWQYQVWQNPRLNNTNSWAAGCS